MTYRDLLESLLKASEEELDQSISVYISGDDEFYPVARIAQAKETDVLSKGDIYLHVGNED